MKAKSTLLIASLAVAFIVMFGVTRVQAECCYLDVITAPIAAGVAVGAAGVEVGVAAVGAAVVGTAAVVAAPFNAVSCGTCGVSYCSPCEAAPAVSWVPGNCGEC